MKLRAREFSKLHHEDPSGFWRLVRTGKSLPAVGDVVMYVHDIRGTEEELRHDLLVKVSKGDPYHIVNSAIESGRMDGRQKITHMIAEAFVLPTEPAKAWSKIGTVEYVDFDETLQEWYIGIVGRITECIVYWAPIPAPPDTYTPRSDDQDQWYFSEMVGRERRIRDRLESRKYRREHGVD
jgi:hypothetical protein